MKFLAFFMLPLLTALTQPAFAQREAVPEGAAPTPSSEKCVTYDTSQAQPQKIFESPVSRITSVTGKITIDGTLVPLQGLPVAQHFNKARITTQPFGSVLVDSTTDHFFLGTAGKSFIPSKRVSVLLNVKGRLIQDKRAIGNVSVCFE